jgi:hypothetical protein
MHAAGNFAPFMRIIVIVLFIWIPGVLPAQKLPPRIRPILMLDTYYSSVGNRGADVFGIKAGVEVDKICRFAAGYNKITTDVVEYKKLPPSEVPYAGQEEVKAQLYMQYFPVMAEFIVYDKDPWQFSLPEQIGYGRSYFQYFDTGGDNRKVFDHGVVIMDLGVAGQYKVLKWFGAGIGLGYRLMLVNNPDIDTDFNTPMVSLRLKFFFGEIYKSIMQPESASSSFVQ